MSTQTFTLPAGTICKHGGIPFALAADTTIECHPDNWPLIQEGFVPGVSYDGQALLCSQSVQALENPREAQPDLTNAVTNSSSLLSSSVFNKSLT